MDIMNIVYPILSIGGLGVVFGAGLGIAGEVFKVDEDPKIGEILEVLPLSLIHIYGAFSPWNKKSP